MVYLNTSVHHGSDDTGSPVHFFPGISQIGYRLLIVLPRPVPGSRYHRLAIKSIDKVDGTPNRFVRPQRSQFLHDRRLFLSLPALKLHRSHAHTKHLRATKHRLQMRSSRRVRFFIFWQGKVRSTTCRFNARNGTTYPFNSCGCSCWYSSLNFPAGSSFSLIRIYDACTTSFSDGPNSTKINNRPIS